MKGAGQKSSLHLAKDNISLDKDKNSTRIALSRLVNYLNRINFRDGDISLHFRHRKYAHSITLSVKPHVCRDNYLRCLWPEYPDAVKKLKHFVFTHLSFTDGLKHIQADARIQELTGDGIFLELPDNGYERKAREIKRHKCEGIKAHVSQDGRIVQGKLESFSAQSFGITLFQDTAHAEQEFDPDLPVAIILRDERNYVYSGNCELIRQNMCSRGNFLVFKPAKENIRIFRPKEIRSERLEFTPIPNIIFTHPLTGRRLSLGLVNISGTGFAVAEDEDNALLMPGLILPDLEIEFIHGFSVRCNAQVVYRNHFDDHVQSGVAILDMEVQDHLKLSSFLHQAKNRHSYISTTNVDLDALWDFFFETGFVYPEKYLHIKEQKEKFSDLYRKLYNESPEISRHVIYQDKGRIYGHVSMFRFYRHTWLMHHHAAVRSSKHKAGLVVMEHILQYINECHTLASSRMKYIACYFRPNNRFANRVFGGAARALDDQKKCSLDAFAYYHFGPAGKNGQLADGWKLLPAEEDDLVILRQWYRNASGGLMLEGLDLTPDFFSRDLVTNQEYSAAEFKRERLVFSLKFDDELMAVFIVNRSDLGLNMSDLTNCIQALVLEEKAVNKDIMEAAMAGLASQYEQPEVPVLLYPSKYAEAHGIRYDKVYELTVLDLEYISPYLQFMRSLTSQKKTKVKDHAINSR